MDDSNVYVCITYGEARQSPKICLKGSGIVQKLSLIIVPITS